MKSMVQNYEKPQWCPWAQDRFVRRVRDEYRLFNGYNTWDWFSHKRGDLKYPEGHWKLEAWLSAAYRKGREEVGLRLDFYQFRWALTCGWRDVDFFMAVPRTYKRLKATSYVKRPHHEALCRPGYDPWRIEKQTKRDKAQVHGRYSHRGRKFCSDQSARSHRAWVTQQISKENWDAFDKGAQDTEYAQFVEPYDWD